MIEYGVATHNKFAFLEEDATDPEEILVKAKEIKKAKEKEAKEKPATAKKVVIVEPPPKMQPELQKPSNERRKDGAGGRGGTGRPKGPGPRTDGEGGRFRQGAMNNNSFGRRKDGEGNETGGGENDGGNRQPPRIRSDRRPPFGDENAPPRGDGNVRGDRDGGYHGPRRNDGGKGPRGSFERRNFQQGGQGRGIRRDGRNRNDGQGYRSRDDQQKQEQNGDVQVPREETNVQIQSGGGGWDDGEDQGTNWGTETTGDQGVVVTEPLPTVDGENPVEGQTPPETGAEAEQPPAEPEKVVKTLEEWKAEAKKLEQAQAFNLRKPGEGGDQKIYQKLIPIKKEVRSAGKDQDEEDDDHHFYKEKRERALNIEIKFSVPKRNFDSRGDRDRGGFNRSGNSGDGAPRGEGFRGDRGPRRDDNRNYGIRTGQGSSQQDGRRQEPPPGFHIESKEFPALGAA